MIAIFGLGNPGPEYQSTRHNFGFMALDFFAREQAVNFQKNLNFLSETANVSINGESILLVKPLTFMNKSGDCIEKIKNYYKLDSSNCWVIFDELDLSLGQIKIRKEGGPGTHNGMKSIVQKIDTKFPRWRLGIESRGKTAPTQQETSSFVLSPFTTEEQKIALQMLTICSQSIMQALSEGIESAMNKFNNYEARD